MSDDRATIRARRAFGRDKVKAAAVVLPATMVRIIDEARARDESPDALTGRVLDMVFAGGRRSLIDAVLDDEG